MTVWVSREPGTDLIRLQVTHGPVTVVADEHEAHMRTVHAELGRLFGEPAALAPADEFRGLPLEAHEPAGSPAGEL